MFCWWTWFERKVFHRPGQAGGIRITALVLEFPGATRNLVFADLKFSSCTLQSPSSFISHRGSHTVLVKKSRSALESGLSSRSHSFTAKLQIIPPHWAREAVAQAHYVLSKSIWEEEERRALFWSTGADEYLREITEVSTAGEREFMYSQRTAYQWCQINHGDPVSAWEWKWTDTLCSLHVCTAAKPNHQEYGISEWLVAAEIHYSSAWDQSTVQERGSHSLSFQKGSKNCHHCWRMCTATREHKVAELHLQKVISEDTSAHNIHIQWHFL